MTIKVPLTYNSEKNQELFSKLLIIAKYLGYLFWVSLIIYFFYNYIKTKSNFSLFFSFFLLGYLLKTIYDKYKTQKK